MSMPDDVTPQQLERQAVLWRALGPEKQVQVAAQVLVDGRRATELAVRARHPEAGDELVRWLVRAAFVGEAVALRLYGPRPER